MPHINLQTSTHPVYSICTKSWSGVSIIHQHYTSAKHNTESRSSFEHLPFKSCCLHQALKKRQHPLPLQLRHLLNNNKTNFISITLPVNKHDSAYPCTCVRTTLQLNKTKHRKSSQYWTVTIPILLPPALAKQQRKQHLIDSSSVQAWVDLSVVEHIAPQLNTAQKLKPKLFAYLLSVDTPNDSVWSSIYTLCSPDRKSVV